MSDFLKTLTTDEIITAKQRWCADESADAENCYQLWRYSRGMIFVREQAERALRKIRETK